MSRALLLDAMLSPKVAEGLRARDVDAYGIAERVEFRALPDADVLELSTAEQRILVTFNIRDFQFLDREWAAAGRSHAGIVYVACRRFPRLGGAIGRLVDALEEMVTRTRQDLPGHGATGFL